MSDSPMSTHEIVGDDARGGVGCNVGIAVVLGGAVGSGVADGIAVRCVGIGAGSKVGVGVGS